MPARFPAESIPLQPDFSFEMRLWERGLRLIAGVDEAGRGALAGPVTAGVLVFPPQPDLANQLSGVRDSKQMTPLARENWVARLVDIALGWAVGFATSVEIDQVGIVPATRLAIQRAMEQIGLPIQHLLVDYLELPDSQVPYTALVKGDARSLSIAAASILAKTARDAHMRDLDKQYPGYGLATHKGYGTLMHRQAISRIGRSLVHRVSFNYERNEADP